MRTIFPTKLKANDTLEVISPSQSANILSDSSIATRRLNTLGLKVNFSANCYKANSTGLVSVRDRVEDIHSAVLDKNIKLILSSVGGHRCNELLNHINYNYIRKNPKIIGGFSDMTVLLNAIYAKTGMITYHSPHFSSFAEKTNFRYTMTYFQKCLFENKEIVITDSGHWSNDAWWLNQTKRNFIKNTGRIVLNEGMTRGIILGGHLQTFALLFDTEYMPSLKNTILFLESNSGYSEQNIRKTIESLTLQEGFNDVLGIVFGRFTKNTIDEKKFFGYIQNNKKLSGIPIIANMNFGHTEPFFTFPIGGEAKLCCDKKDPSLTITKH